MFALFTEERGGFPLVLTRVPCVGEHIAREAEIYRVVHVEHQMLDNHGWNAFGSHSIVDVVRVPDEPRPRPKRKSAARKPRPT